MRTIKFDNYRIKARTGNSRSNYNLWVAVFLAGNKNPEFGQHFKENTTDRELLEWAFSMIDNQPKQNLTIEDFLIPPNTI